MSKRKKMNRLTAANWGLKLKMRKMLYKLVAERIILFATPIWYNGKVVLANRLQSIERVCGNSCV